MVESKLQWLENERQKDPPFPSVNSLYCQEEHWKSYNVCFDSITDNNISNIESTNGTTIQILSEQDLCWEDPELSTMLSKEVENRLYHAFQTDPSLAIARREAVEWMIKVHAHYSFSLHTAFLAVNYLDRFLFGFKFQTEKPWLTQLTAVACLSLAAKIEETYVPLLLDLQVEETKYMFEVKTIQRMEILILSTLGWKMNLVTPYSFMDYMIRRLRLKDHLCLEFLRRCEMVLLATVSDSRFICYLPSVMAAATMLHVINNFEHCIGEEYQNKLFDTLGINKDRVEECGELILELEEEGRILFQSNKRKWVSMPRSPHGVVDISFSSDNSNHSWVVASSSVSSSPEPLAKKMRADQHQNLETNHPSVESLSIFSLGSTSFNVLSLFPYILLKIRCPL